MAYVTTVKDGREWVDKASFDEKCDLLASLQTTLDGRELRIRELETTVRLREATPQAWEAEIVKLRMALNETWMDEHETVWTRPTAWAYAMVCKARDKHEQEARRLREALQVLYDEQNDAPLENRRQQWQAAMTLASDALRQTGA